ncbi:hypothetical protein [Streptacidiphilus sp. EB103A]|uniref:hypothetical protein n=1 Tax=Streptacidiphilus sp. EB103A TaxID=3156275 RepID=UPI00351301FC
MELIPLQASGESTIHQIGTTDYGIAFDHHGRALVEHNGFRIRLRLADCPGTDTQVQARSEVLACNGSVVLADCTSSPFDPYDFVSYGPRQWLQDAVQSATETAVHHLRELHALHSARTNSRS